MATSLKKNYKVQNTISVVGKGANEPVETNDTETQTKNDVMALISKSYALFYMDPSNQHPNIPSQASYNAVDDSDIFQKYV